MSSLEGPEWTSGARRNVGWSLSQLLGPLTLMVFNCANQMGSGVLWVTKSMLPHQIPEASRESGIGDPKPTMAISLVHGLQEKVGRGD